MASLQKLGLLREALEADKFSEARGVLAAIEADTKRAKAAAAKRKAAAKKRKPRDPAIKLREEEARAWLHLHGWRKKRYRDISMDTTILIHDCVENLEFHQVYHSAGCDRCGHLPFYYLPQSWRELELAVYLRRDMYDEVLAPTEKLEQAFENAKAQIQAKCQVINNKWEAYRRNKYRHPEHPEEAVHVADQTT